MNSQATVGQIVHYLETETVVAGGEKLQRMAAIVNRDTGIDGTAELTVFVPEGPMVVKLVPYSEEYCHAHWSWMPVPEDILALREWIGDITKQFGDRIGELEKEPDLVPRVEALETMRDNAQDTE